VAAAQARRQKLFGGDADGDGQPGAPNKRDKQAGGDETYNRVHEARRSSAEEKKNKYSIQKRGYVADEEAVRVLSVKYTIFVCYFGCDVLVQDGRRGASKTMMQNRGLTPHRSKDKKNPRVKHRNAFEKRTQKNKTRGFGAGSSGGSKKS
jgi:hypothetical protein